MEMKLEEHFEKSGNFFFRYRSYLPFIFLPILIAGFINFKYPKGSHILDVLWELICFLVSISGFVIRILVSGSVPSGTSGRNTEEQKASILNTTGLYSLVRHPLYLGNYLIVLGASFVPRHWFLPIIVSLVFILYYERMIFVEEKFLESKFGEEFRKWAENTPAILPRIRNYKPSILPFSWRAAIKKEYHTVLGITGAFFGLDLIGDFFIYKEIRLDPLWTPLFIGGFLFYIIVRIIKRKTKFLRVEGR